MYFLLQITPNLAFESGHRNWPKLPQQHRFLDKSRFYQHRLLALILNLEPGRR